MMKNSILSALSLALALGFTTAVSLEADNSENALLVDPRALQESASGSASGSLPAVLATFSSLLDLMDGLLALFPFLAGLIAMLLAIFEAIATILGGRRLMNRELSISDGSPRALKSSKADPDLVEGLTSAIEMIMEIVSDLMELRDDPDIGTALDEQICALYDVAGEMEAIIYGGRRALKAKSGKTAGFSCPKAGKSAKTYSPSPTATVVETYYYKSAKAKSYYTAAPEEAGGAGGRRRSNQDKGSKSAKVPKE